jgi:hypothetical protein
MAASSKDKITPITTPPYQVPSADVTPDPLYGLLQAFFIEGDPHSKTEIGERDIVLSA